MSSTLEVFLSLPSNLHQQSLLHHLGSEVNKAMELFLFLFFLTYLVFFGCFTVGSTISLGE